MKSSTNMCVSIFALAVVTMTANGVLAEDAHAGAVTHRRQHGLLTVDQKARLTCPSGRTVFTNPTTGKQSCVQDDMAVKGSGVPKNPTTVTTLKGKSTDSTAPQ